MPNHKIKSRPQIRLMISPVNDVLFAWINLPIQTKLALSVFWKNKQKNNRIPTQSHGKQLITLYMNPATQNQLNMSWQMCCHELPWNIISISIAVSCNMNSYDNKHCSFCIDNNDSCYMSYICHESIWPLQWHVYGTALEQTKKQQKDQRGQCNKGHSYKVWPIAHIFKNRRQHFCQRFYNET